MKRMTLTLAGGTLALGPLLAATIRDNKEALRAAQQGQLQPMEMVELTCTLAHACAKRIDSAVTLARVEDLVDMENVNQVFAACWGVSVPEPTPGEALQAGSPST